MKRLKHLWNLLKEFSGFAATNKAWWIVPLVVFLLLISLIILVGSGVAPFIYPLF